MALKNWEPRHLESQLLKNLRTATHSMVGSATLEATGWMFEVAVDGSVSGSGADEARTV